MLSRILPLIFAASILAATTAIAQQTVLPQADRNGDYTTTRIPYNTTYTFHTQWTVKASALNCRVSPGLQNPVMKVWPRGTTLRADPYNGEYAARDPIQIDRDGKPWLIVGISPTPTADGNNCYVRAHHRYIAPISP